MKKLILIIFLLASNFSFSQEINIVKEGYYILYDSINGERNYFDENGKASEAEAIQGIYNRQVITGKRAWYDSPTHRIDFKDFNKRIEIDTIQAIRVKDLKGWIDRSNLGTEISKPIAYLPFYEYAIIDFEIDTIYNWQSKYNFKRTKTFGKVSYENLTIPFQIVDIWIDKTDNSTYGVNLTTTEYPKQTSCYLNGELYKQFTPGSFRKDSEFEYFGIWGLYDLDAAIDYEVKTVVEGVDGDIVEFIHLIKR